MLKRFLFPIALLAAISCAQPRDEMAPETSRTVRTEYRGLLSVDVHGSIDPSQHIVSAPVDSVWVVLPGVYERLEVETNLLDPSSYQLGNTRFDRSYLGGERLSRYLRCGYGVSSSNNADTYRVTMSLITRVRVNERRQTVLQTEISASAKPRMVSGNAVNCTSTGRLERRIAELVWESLENASLERP